MRTYSFVAGTRASRRGFDFWPPRICTSRARIRVVAAILLRKWFGNAAVPSSSWAVDGFMAEAYDRRGNFIQVEQVNHYHRHAAGATQMHRPLCPMVLPKGAKR